MEFDNDPTPVTLPRIPREARRSAPAIPANSELSTVQDVPAIADTDLDAGPTSAGTGTGTGNGNSERATVQDIPAVDPAREDSGLDFVVEVAEEGDDDDEATAVDPAAVGKARQDGPSQDILFGSRPPPPRKPALTPPRINESELFDDLSEIPIPPPLAMEPKKQQKKKKFVVPITGRATALRDDLLVRWPSILVMVACALGGAAVASVVFLVLGLHNRNEQPAPPRPNLSATRGSTATLPAGKLDRKVPKRPDTTLAKASALQLKQEGQKEQAPPPARPSASPLVDAGKQVARAILPCKLHKGSRPGVVRIGARLLTPGRIWRAYVGKHPRIKAKKIRCIKRRLMGLKLDGFAAKGYVDWRLRVAPDDVDAVPLLRRLR
jgi:hypothetical protein